MQTVKVARGTLIEKIKANRDDHREVFLKAQEKFKAAVIERLDTMLADARAGKKVSQYINLTAPQDHTKDYDNILAMLELSVDDVIELTQADFRQYVMDQWAWASQFGETAMSYGISNKYLTSEGDD